jgi:hypothetical protein
MNQTLAVTKIEAVEEIGPGIFEVRVLVPSENLIRGGFAGVIESRHARGRWLRSSGC